jgi:hypothetical protein
MHQYVISLFEQTHTKRRREAAVHRARVSVPCFGCGLFGLENIECTSCALLKEDCSSRFYIVVIICIHFVYCVLYCVCSFVCCVSFDRDVILCDVCYLFVVSYCITTATG